MLLPLLPSYVGICSPSSSLGPQGPTNRCTSLAAAAPAGVAAAAAATHVSTLLDVELGNGSSGIAGHNSEVRALCSNIVTWTSEPLATPHTSVGPQTAHRRCCCYFGCCHGSCCFACYSSSCGCYCSCCGAHCCRNCCQIKLTMVSPTRTMEKERKSEKRRRNETGPIHSHG